MIAIAERKALSKKIRFEVFKRDKFTCQYCGRSAPDAILEIDHISPVSDGGSNDILNLITSCRDCNRGKGKRTLSDNTAIQKQREQLAELSERKDQLEMMIEWRESVRDISKKEVETVCNEFEKLTGYEIPKNELKRVESWLHDFSFAEVLDAMDIAVNSYFDHSRDSARRTLWKIGGVCYNRKYQGDKRYQFNYLRKCCIHNFHECDEDILQRIVNNIKEPVDFKYVVDDLKARKSWEDFMYGNYDPLMDEDDEDER